MDFGEILKLWDEKERLPEKSRRVKEVKPSAPKRRSEVEVPKTAIARTQAAWLESHDVPHPLERGDSDHAPRRLARREIDAIPFDATLDLHGMTTMESEIALESFFAHAERTGCVKVLIVHGKGIHSKSEPVLANFVTRWLERRKSAGRTGRACQADGGGGATWVMMKRGDDQRSR